MAERTALSPNQKRIRNILISFPIMILSGYALFNRLYLGAEQKKIDANSPLVQGTLHRHAQSPQKGDVVR